MTGTKALAAFLSLFTLLGCAMAAPAAPSLYRADCRNISPRVPPILAELPWVAETSPDTHVFGGDSNRLGNPWKTPMSEASSSWLVTGGIHLELREVDLNGDRLCDLVGTARVAIGTGGDSDVSLVFWFASPTGWRRQGPDWGERASALNPMSRALLGPDNAADAALYGYGIHVPVRLADGRVVLAARAWQNRGPAKGAPVAVLAYDPKRAAMVQLASADALAATLGALADRVCVQESSTDEACFNWYQ